MKRVGPAALILGSCLTLDAQPVPPKPPSVTVRLMLPDGAPRDATVFAASLAGPKLGRLLDPIRVSGTTAGTAVTFELPAGRWTLGVDTGSSRAPWIRENVDVRKGSTTELNVRPEPGSELTLLVLARGDRKPVSGARVEPATAGSPAEKVLAALFGKRAGSAKEDGLLRLGTVASAEPLAVTVGAPGLRRAALRLPAGFEPGRRPVLLAPLQSVEVHVTGLTLKRGDPAPVVELARCRIQEPRASCQPEPATESRALGADGISRLRPAQPGRYVLRLLVPGVGGTRDDVTLSADSADPDTVVRTLAVDVWRLQGRTHLRSGEGVEADLTAVEFISGLGEGSAATGSSGPDGRFEIEVVSSAGRGMRVRAATRDPIGKGESRMVTVKDGETTVEDVDILIETGLVEVVLKDRETLVPVSEGCEVELRSVADEPGAGALMQIDHPDAKGRIVLDGLRASDVHVAPACPGYATPPPRTVTLSANEHRDIEFLLDRSDGFRLRVVDRSGRPVAGAQVFCAQGLTGRIDVGFGDEPEEVGSTDAFGELPLPGEVAGLPFFVVAPGSALGIGVFPPARRCPDPSSCLVTHALSPLQPFGGLIVRTAAGKALRERDVFFVSGAGVVIARSVIADGARANEGLVRFVSDSETVMTPVLFPEGAYSVQTFHKGRFEDRGVVRVPSWEPVTFVVPDPLEGVKVVH